MRKLLLVPVAVLLVACTPSPGDAPAPGQDPLAAAVRKANADYARMRARDPDTTARETTALEYPAYRELMQVSGLDAALGGEAAGDAALRALFAGFERKTRSLREELPKMLPAAYSGIDLGYSGFAASMITGDLQNAAAIEMWDRAQQEGKTTGSFTQTAGDGSQVSMQWNAGHASSTTVFEGKLPGGLQGKVTTKVEVTTCPDASGKVDASFTSEAQIRASGQAGTGGTIKVSARMGKFLDDDANLIDDKMESEVHVDQRTFDSYEGSFVDITDTLSTSSGEMGTKVNGRGGKANDASVQAAKGIADMARMAAMQALEAAKKGWESGRCVDLQATSSPGKRKGVKPGTAFDVEARPRAKSDGAPAGGTVTATLSGGASLQPAGGKVRADAKYAYRAPEEKDKSASIAFEARSKRGVGRAMLEFDTRQRRAYRFTMFPGCGAAAGPVVCDFAKPFHMGGRGCAGGATTRMTFVPTDQTAGKLDWTTTIDVVRAGFQGTYTVKQDDTGATIDTTLTGCAMGPGAKACGGTGPSLLMEAVDASACPE